MATATKKTFPTSDTRANQILFLLEEDGPQTVWQLVDKVKKYNSNIRWGDLRRSLDLLRNKEKVGVINWIEEETRQKTAPKNGNYYYTRQAYTERSKKIGQPTNGKSLVEVWALINNDD